MDSVDFELRKRSADWLDQGRRVLLVTVVKTWGSSPRPENAMLRAALRWHDPARARVRCDAGRNRTGCTARSGVTEVDKAVRKDADATGHSHADAMSVYQEGKE